MKITYIFHSCFIVELQHHILIFDYYKGTLPPIDTHKHILFFVSHKHHDHYTKKIWKFHTRYPRVNYIIDDAISMPDFVKGIKVCPNQDYEYEDIHIHTLRSTDEGVAFYLQVEDKIIYHAGDLNWWHWEGEPIQDNEWQNMTFHKEIQYLRHKHIDLAFLPLDPRQEDNAWWGFLDVLRICDISYCFPMHFGKDMKKMQAYLTLGELTPYRNQIMKIDYESQSFTFK